MINKDIIIVGQQAWDTDIGSNCKNIALEMSKNNRVLYVNSPLDRITLLRNKTDIKVKRRIDIIRKKEEGLIQIKENLWNYYPDCLVESINWIDNQFIFKELNKRNNNKLAQSIKKALTALDFENYILFNDNEIFKGFYLNKYLSPEISVYYSRDYMIGVDYWKKHGEKLEPVLISKNDLCVANSNFLTDYCKQYNPNSYYVGQGCEVEAFTSGIYSRKPEDLLGIKRPIIGYVGSLNSNRLDINIIEDIAINFPDYSIVLIGPEDDVFKSSTLHQQKNVYFGGSKRVEELPSYINAFDVCINPQLVNEITIGNYPRKVDEYLALGKPVVATKTKTMESFGEYVYLVEENSNYIDSIQKAIFENNESISSERIKFAASHTWENSVSEIFRLIKNTMENVNLLNRNLT
jgi:glycosyltransferase involved in cell wall biosynthesis